MENIFFSILKIPLNSLNVTIEKSLLKESQIEYRNKNFSGSKRMQKGKEKLEGPRSKLLFAFSIVT